MTGLDILIPCKGFSRGKSRLAPVLSPAARALLCRDLLVDTVSLAAVFGSRVGVVSSDAEVIDLAQRLDVRPIVDRGVGLNAALSEANTRLLCDHGPNPLLVMPIDLPLLDRTALEEFLGRSAEILIAPDSKNQGTNLLRLGSAARDGFGFRYGPGSFDRHVELAALHGLSVSVFRDDRTAFDLDEPQDLEFAAKHLHRRHPPAATRIGAKQAPM